MRALCNSLLRTIADGQKASNTRDEVVERWTRPRRCIKIRGLGGAGQAKFSLQQDTENLLRQTHRPSALIASYHFSNCIWFSFSSWYHIWVAYMKQSCIFAGYFLACAHLGMASIVNDRLTMAMVWKRLSILRSFTRSSSPSLNLKKRVIKRKIRHEPAMIGMANEASIVGSIVNDHSFFNDSTRRAQVQGIYNDTMATSWRVSECVNHF